MEPVNTGRILEALNNKTDRNMRNVDTTAKADSVIDYQVPTEENGYTWYRKYASGWVEQGGVVENLSSNIVEITLPIIMMNDRYVITTSGHVNNQTAQYVYIRNAPTTSKISLKANSGTITLAYWQVCGMAA